jgi:transposase
MEEAAMAHKQAHEARQRESHKKPRRPQPSLLERIQPDAAGVDCGERSHFVAVPLERDPEPVREFRTFTAELIRLADWLAQCRVRTLAMESTGVYWIPLYEILEERGFEVVNARDVHNVPGPRAMSRTASGYGSFTVWGLLELSGILCLSQWLMSEAVVSNNC